MQNTEKTMEKTTEELSRWQARALAAEAEAAALREELVASPRIVTGGGMPPRSDVLYAREDIAKMSAEEINSKWQDIKNSLKRLV